MRNGKLSKNELATIKKAYMILSAWTVWAEQDAEKHGYEPECDYGYSCGMAAVAGMGEFLREAKFNESIAEIY